MMFFGVTCKYSHNCIALKHFNEYHASNTLQYTIKIFLAKFQKPRIFAIPQPVKCLIVESLNYLIVDSLIR